jgi:hypothetical protein
MNGVPLTHPKPKLILVDAIELWQVEWRSWHPSRPRDPLVRTSVSKILMYTSVVATLLCQADYVNNGS